MKTLLKIILVLIIIILVLVIIAGAYIWVKNPIGLRDVVENKISPTAVEMDESYDNPLLDADQEKQLRDIGIDPAKVPTEITAEQEKCLQDKLGQDRIDALLKGGSPTALEALKASSCL